MKMNSLRKVQRACNGRNLDTHTHKKKCWATQRSGGRTLLSMAGEGVAMSSLLEIARFVPKVRQLLRGAGGAECAKTMWHFEE